MVSAGGGPRDVVGDERRDDGGVVEGVGAAEVGVDGVGVPVEVWRRCVGCWGIDVCMYVCMYGGRGDVDI